MIPNLKELAKVGAQARLNEIRKEQDALLAMFPELKKGSGPAAPQNGAPARTRRTMSAAQRKAVAMRMKAYWANKRAEKAGAVEGGGGVSASQDGAGARKAGRTAGRKQGRKK